MQDKELKVDSTKLKIIIEELDELGYDYIEGFKTNKKDKVRAIHRKCGNERFTKFSLYSQKECRFCKRPSTSGKFQKSMSPEDKALSIKLHSEGKTNVEIANQLGFSNSAIRQYLKKQGLKSNRVESSLKEVNCIVCGTTFMPKYHNRNKVCSNFCKAKNISDQKKIYIQDEIDKVVTLKKKFITNDEISRLTKVNINKVKEIVKEKGLELTSEQGQRNAYQTKVRKNPNAMKDMRDSRIDCPTNKFNKKINKIVEKLKEDDGLGIPYLSKKEGLFDTSVRRSLKLRGYKDLIGKQTSGAEREILDFIKEILPDGVEIICNDRSILEGKEIDILIPSINLGIEYCGLYWHNEDSPEPRKRTFHRDKTRKAKDKGISLLTIFEDEWLEKEKQVKGFLKSTLGVIEKRIYARKCNVKEVDKQDAKAFLESYHIQGSGRIQIAYGLYDREELVGLVTANQHHRQGNSGSMVLNRLVFKEGVQVIGGASRLTKYLVDYSKKAGYEKLISWSDNRWSSEGNVYEKIGFSLDKDLGPDYSYYIGSNRRKSKQSCTKEKLENIGAVGDTESEMAKSLGYSKIWDCGKKRWVLDL